MVMFKSIMSICYCEIIKQKSKFKFADYRLFVCLCYY